MVRILPDSYRNTGRWLVSTTNLLLTGRPGIGKTTVCRTVAERLPAGTRGFLTEEIREDGSRSGFRIRLFSGEKRVLSHVDFDGPRVGKYGVDVDAMEEFAVPAIEQALRDQTTRRIIIDEIGKMELKSERFAPVVRRCLDATLPLIATVPRRGPGFVSEVRQRSDTRVLEVTRENRDRLPDRIVKTFSAGE